ncbi:hypothetical protein EJB05_46533 [Eragrostis curvula]|uniref:Uncharacterized protein n=1 Tax=Eragrostis curvula TaxID=38414 RepID=A0A5J9TNP4_9POAL|nr:hypothetical protein EJB05_46533 [Eragrostis curvula]
MLQDPIDLYPSRDCSLQIAGWLLSSLPWRRAGMATTLGGYSSYTTISSSNPGTISSAYTSSRGSHLSSISTEDDVPDSSWRL